MFIVDSAVIIEILPFHGFLWRCHLPSVGEDPLEVPPYLLFGAHILEQFFDTPSIQVVFEFVGYVSDRLSVVLEL